MPRDPLAEDPDPGGRSAIVAVAAFYFLVLSPKREEAATLDGQIAAKQAQLDQSARAGRVLREGAGQLRDQLHDAGAARQGRPRR